MKPKVYVETSVISYLAARPSRDLVIAGHQQTTQDWWRTARDRFDLFTSEVVVDEASAGDLQLAAQRLLLLSPLTLLDVTEEVDRLAQEFIDAGAMPEAARPDAIHVGIAATHGMDYLVTWNCRHLANAVLRPRIDAVCRSAGLVPVAICTPEQLMEEETDD